MDNRYALQTVSHPPYHLQHPAEEQARLVGEGVNHEEHEMARMTRKNAKGTKERA